MKVIALFSLVKLCRQAVRGDGNTTQMNTDDCLTARILFLEKELSSVKKERDDLFKQHHITIQNAKRKESNARDPEAG